jgi:hypothetical protein
MPNWCANTLMLTHSDSSMIDRVEKSVNTESLFEEFAPLGEWAYDPAVEKWGTKWDITDGEMVDRNDDTITVSFSTAWSPPINFYEELIRQGFKVTADYFEPGMGYIGTYIDGEDEDYEIDSDNLENIPEDLKEKWGIEEWYNDE